MPLGEDSRCSPAQSRKKQTDATPEALSLATQTLRSRYSADVALPNAISAVWRTSPETMHRPMQFMMSTMAVTVSTLPSSGPRMLLMSPCSRSRTSNPEAVPPKPCEKTKGNNMKPTLHRRLQARLDRFSPRPDGRVVERRERSPFKVRIEEQPHALHPSFSAVADKHSGAAKGGLAGACASEDRSVANRRVLSPQAGFTHLESGSLHRQCRTPRRPLAWQRPSEM